MKIKLTLFALIISMSFAVFGQLKDQQKLDKISEAIAGPQVTSSIFSFLSSDKLQMNHTFYSAFSSFGSGQSQLTNAYMNTILYKFDAPLTLRLNLGLMNSPYTSFESTPGFDPAQFRFFGDAQLEYRPSDKTRLILGVSKMPAYSRYPGMGLYPSDYR